MQTETSDTPKRQLHHRFHCPRGGLPTMLVVDEDIPLVEWEAIDRFMRGYIAIRETHVTTEVAPITEPISSAEGTVQEGEES